MTDPFITAVEFVLSFEQEWSNDSNDPGGLTRWGISQRAYPNVNLKTLTRDQAIDTYRQDYWNRCDCDQFPPATAVMLFDSAVNQGPNAAIRMLQSALKVTPDGIIGNVTLDAAKAQSHDGVVDFFARRAYTYAANPLFGRDGLGWMRRLGSCLRLALTL